MNDNAFQYSKQEINELKEQFDVSKAEMKGYNNELLKLKESLEEFYSKEVFHMGMSLDDAPYHGWFGEPLKNMCKIDKEIHRRFKEIYAIILKGLGD